MTKLAPTDPFPDWDGQTTLQRVLACAAMLHVHDFLTDKERKDVQKRVAKWLDRQRVKDGLEIGMSRAKPQPLRLVCGGLHGKS